MEKLPINFKHGFVIKDNKICTQQLGRFEYDNLQQLAIPRYGRPVSLTEKGIDILAIEDPQIAEIGPLRRVNIIKAVKHGGYYDYQSREKLKYGGLDKHLVDESSSNFDWIDN